MDTHEDPQDQQDLLALLAQKLFSKAACEAVLEGRLPLPGHLGNPDVRLCLVAGIRRHDALARSEQLTRLCNLSFDGPDDVDVDVFVRARNARLIMSGEVPPMGQISRPNHQPYCIWYPDVAAEDTYRQLATLVPAMRYQVGRACAVAGYADLYHELGLLPDPSIAEEARESPHEASRAIYTSIMTAPVRYAVMNDYTLTITLDSPQPGAVLNADTAVLSTLAARYKFEKTIHRAAPQYYFNITEDLGVGMEQVDPQPAILAPHEAALLTQPLPRDLPTIHKDLLILVAAYEGNVDRYARLRRPGRSVAYELHCLVPGVHRNTAMAMWLSRHPEIIKVVEDDWNWVPRALHRAINARHVMNGYTDHLMPTADPFVPDDELPYWIWYPTIPAPSILYKLAQARPAMRPQCVRACIAGDFKNTYTDIMNDYGPDEFERDKRHDRVPLPAVLAINVEAERSVSHEWYLEDLSRRREELGITPNRPSRRGRNTTRWQLEHPWMVGDQYSGEDLLAGGLTDDAQCIVLEGQDWGMWELLGAELGRVRRFSMVIVRQTSSEKNQQGDGGPSGPMAHIRGLRSSCRVGMTAVALLLSLSTVLAADVDVVTPLLHNVQLQYCPQACEFAGPDPAGWTTYHSMTELELCQESPVLFVLAIDADPEHTRIKACSTLSAGPQMQVGAFYGLLNNNVTAQPSPEIIMSELALGSGDEEGGREGANARMARIMAARADISGAVCGLAKTHRATLEIKTQWWSTSSQHGTVGTSASSGGGIADALAKLQRHWASGDAGCGYSVMFARSGASVATVIAGGDLVNSGVADLIDNIAGLHDDGGNGRLAAQACGPPPADEAEDSTASLARIFFDTRFGLFADEGGDVAFLQDSVKRYMRSQQDCIDFAGVVSGSDTSLRSVTVLGDALDLELEPVLAPALASGAPSAHHRHGRHGPGMAHTHQHQALHRRATCRDTQVVSGDTCPKLAARCGITSKEFMVYNGLRNSTDFCNNLAVKQYVCCSAGDLPDHTPQPNADGTCQTYTLAMGDGCWAIGDKFGVTEAWIEEVNARTFGFAGCGKLARAQVICISKGDPPMPAYDPSAVCGPWVVGTKRPANYDDVPRLNPCPLNACCDVWGQCGTTAEFCTKSEVNGHVGTAMPSTNGCISNCGTDIINNGAGPASFAKVGYFEAWNKNRPCLRMDVTQIDLSAITHIHFAFAGISSPDFKVTLDKDVQEQFDKFKNMDSKGVKKILSFGGWSFSTDYDTAPIFGTSVSAANRQTFATNVVQFLKDNNLDGLDFDWEYPGATDIPGSVPGSPTDGANYLAFLQAVKSKLPVGKTVSIALPASYWYLRGFPVNKMATIVNYFVYMTYDLHGQWDAGSKWSNPGCPTGSCLRSHVNRTETINALSMVTKAGARTNQIMLGVSSYGRSFRMKDPNCTGVDCLFTGSNTASEAHPGSCTRTRGYISDAEIANIIAADETGRVTTWLDQRSASNIMTWDGNWVAYMDKDQKLAQTRWAEALKLGGTTDWAIDLQTWHEAVAGDTSGGENIYGKVVECTATFNSLDALELSASAGSVPPSCLPIYLLETLTTELDHIIATYEDTNNNYEGKFAHYADYVASLVDPKLNVWMDNFNYDETEKKGLGNKYFNCKYKSALASGWEYEGPCPVPSRAMQQGGQGDPEHDPESWTITYTLRDEQGYKKALSDDLGISPDWIVWGSRDRGVPHVCERPTLCTDQYHQYLNGNFPRKAQQITVTDPKTIWDSAMANIGGLRDQFAAAILSVSLGLYDPKHDPMEAAIALAVPVQMLAQARQSMEQVKEIGGEIEEREKKEHILLIVTIVLMVFPFVAEIGLEIAGLATMARLAMIAGEIANGALSVIDIMEDPSSAPMAIMGMLLGAAGAGKGKTLETNMEEAVKTKNLMDAGAVAKMGNTFKIMDDKVREISKSCSR
ncbi:uncharacterized protein B0I36DRAFT_349766 [Microdochium trichocladiopsis]|uniref:chitinase n=1 Tax=Microdochium trichocladiopsis TaxID=1682393 RepID=A0A9P9BSE7_9PEZI|nr:uncharacterized protein B0I36DRAFT_349766 [Microdochium trichocladiopsis]KAH7028766.1 hypothetical protein B0I36DRAFT_349766 [Microdochium trichocladiopsis]